jgi:hypothetical protein
MTLQSKIVLNLTDIHEVKYNDNIGFGTIRIKMHMFSKYDECTFHIDRKALLLLKKELNEKLP